MSLEIENRAFDEFLFTAVPLSEVDLLRRTVPTARDVFDQFLFHATAYAVYEGTWDMFVGASRRFLNITGRRPGVFLPPLIPPDVAEAVADIMSRFPCQQPGVPIIDGHQMTTPDQRRIGDELMLTLGGDHGDGVHAAGTRAYTKMMSARIGDGFVHPVVGGRVWSRILDARIPTPDAGPPLTGLPSIAHAVDEWLAASAVDRSKWERHIIDHAHSHGWTGGL